MAVTLAGRTGRSKEDSRREVVVTRFQRHPSWPNSRWNHSGSRHRKQRRRDPVCPWVQTERT